MKSLCLAVLLLAACFGAENDGNEQTAAIPEQPCLRLEIVVGEGYRVDDQPVAAGDVGAALSDALAAGNRTAIVDISCSEGATLEAVRELHDILLAQGLNRIQYFRDPEPPIPLVLPDDQMAALLADMPDENRCVVAIAPTGQAAIEGETFSRESVVEKLEENHDVVFIVAATDDVAYADFTRVLGEITGAGAQRVSVQLVEG